MSEIINNDEIRLKKLVEFSKGIMEGKKDGKKLFDEYEKIIETVTPYEVLNLGNRLVDSGMSIEYIKSNIEKIMNIFYTPLKNYIWEKPNKNHILYYYYKENEKLKNILEKVKEEAVIKQDIKALKKYLGQISEIDKHYIRQENILYSFNS